MVKGVKLTFSDFPVQEQPPREYKFNRDLTMILDKEIKSLALRDCFYGEPDSTGGFVSNVFLRPKPGGGSTG